MLLPLILLLASQDTDWPQILGPRRDGVSSERGLNLDWRRKPPRELWKVPLGSAASSMAVVGDRLYTTARRGERDFVLCLDARTGREVWAHDAAPSYVDRQRQIAGPRATPTFHDGKLYCLFGNGEFLCLSAADGKPVWKADIFKDTGARNPAGEVYYWGVSLSPLVEGDLVIAQPGGNQGNSIVAFHKDTGKLVWGAGEDPPGYSSPVAITVSGTRQLVCATGQSVLGLDPEKGKLLWRYAFGNKFSATAATPLYVDGLLFVSAAYGAGSAAFEIVREGDSWKAREKWRKKDLQNLMATSMAHEGVVYGCHGDLGAITLRCMDLKTGELKWQERQAGRVSFLLVEGHLLSLSERGTLQLIEADPSRLVVKGEVRDVLEPKAWAYPALSNGRLYLRDEKHAVCLDLR